MQMTVTLKPIRYAYSALRNNLGMEIEIVYTGFAQAHN